MKNPDSKSGLFFLAFGIVILTQSLKLPFGSISQPESGFFPTIISVLLMTFSLLVLGISFSRGHREVIDFGHSYHMIGITIVTIVLYAFFIDDLGYLICTFLAGIILMKWIQRRSWQAAVIFSALYSGISYFGFQAIGVLLPRGILFFL
jgi:putative tricarboxylic transport membrane protein